MTALIIGLAIVVPGCIVLGVREVSHKGEDYAGAQRQHDVIHDILYKFYFSRIHMLEPEIVGNCIIFRASVPATEKTFRLKEVARITAPLHSNIVIIEPGIVTDGKYRVYESNSQCIGFLMKDLTAWFDSVTGDGMIPKLPASA